MPAFVVPDPPLVDPHGRFVLRPWTEADAEALSHAWRDPDIAGWCTVPADASVHGALRWIAGWQERVDRGIALDLVAAAVDTDEVLGELGLRRLARPASRPGPEVVEVGWWIGAAYRGTGVAARAAGLLAAWAVGATGHQVVARVPTGNVASERIAEAAGLARRGNLPTGFSLWAGPAPC